MVSQLENDPLFDNPPLTRSAQEMHEVVFRRARKLYSLNLEKRWEAITGKKLDVLVSNTLVELIYTYDSSTSSRSGLNFGVNVFSCTSITSSNFWTSSIGFGTWWKMIQPLVDNHQLFRLTSTERKFSTKSRDCSAIIPCQMKNYMPIL